MGGKEEKLYRALNPEKQKDYPCMWYEGITCPIRTQWKLSPESLAPWCTVCKQIGFLDEEKEKLKQKVEVRE